MVSLALGDFLPNFIKILFVDNLSFNDGSPLNGSRHCSTKVLPDQDFVRQGFFLEPLRSFSIEVAKNPAGQSLGRAKLWSSNVWTRLNMAADESDSDLKPSSVAIIREVYDSENAHIKFEMELERALEAGVGVIVIEPEPLGEETVRWIFVGNILHKTSVFSGLCSIVAGGLSESLLCAPFGIVSVLCAGCYTVAWQWDPCCKYQLEKDRRQLSTLPVLTELTSASPVVLVQKSNRRKIFIHSTVSIAATAVCLWRLFKLFK